MSEKQILTDRLRDIEARLADLRSSSRTARGTARTSDKN